MVKQNPRIRPTGKMTIIVETDVDITTIVIPQVEQVTYTPTYKPPKALDDIHFLNRAPEEIARLDVGITPIIQEDGIWANTTIHKKTEEEKRGTRSTD